MSQETRFASRIDGSEKRRAYVPLPFDPAELWGKRARYHVNGTPLSFHRKNCVRWIDATKRSPEVRAARIAETMRLLKAGRKGRPR